MFSKSVLSCWEDQTAQVGQPWVQAEVMRPLGRMQQAFRERSFKLPWVTFAHLPTVLLILLIYSTHLCIQIGSVVHHKVPYMENHDFRCDIRYLLAETNNLEKENQEHTFSSVFWEHIYTTT